MTTPPTTRAAHPGARPATGDRMRGLAATTGLLLLVLGLPIVLELARHRLLPAGFGWDDLGLILTSPASGTLALIVLGCVTWAAWAYLTLTVALEVAAVTGRVHRPRLFGLPRGLARRLVTTASLLFVVSVPPALADVPAADAAASHTDTVVPHTTSQRAGGARTPTHTAPDSPGERPSAPGREAARPRTVPHTVVEDESLWSIAQEQLGDAMRFTEIRDLNRDVLAGRPDFLIPGTVLRLPAAPDHDDGPDAAAAPADNAEPAALQASPAGSSGATTVVVDEGDTLSQIALDELGDAGRYADVARASAHTVQPDGNRLTDPDHIKPGWRLTIPAVTPAPPRKETLPEADNAQPSSSSAPSADRDRDLPQATPEGDTAPEVGTPVPSDRDSSGRDAADRGGAAADEEQRASSEHDPAPQPNRSGRPDQAPAEDAEKSPHPVTEPALGGSGAHQGVHGGVPSPGPTGQASHTEQATPHTNPWAPGTPASPAPRRTPEPQTTSPAPGDADREDEVDIVGPAWLLPGLAGAGAMLAAGLLVAVRRRRAAQWRYRRPGRTITPAPRQTVATERTVHVTGPTRDGDIDALDRLLRALAGPRLDDPAVTRPELVAIELTNTGAVAHLARPADLPLPWVGSGTRWTAPLAAAPPATDDLLAPYPLLVSVGMDAHGHTWLLDLEQARAVTVTGDPEAVAAFGRYVTAELLLHPWAENTTLHTLATGWQVSGLSEAGHHHDHADDSDTLACVTEVDDAVQSALHIPAQEWDWNHAVIATTGIGPTTRSALSDLISALRAADERTGAVVVDLAPDTATTSADAAQATPTGLVLEVRDDGRLRVPELGWDLAAVGLTEHELAASVAIVEVTRETTNPLPQITTVEPADQTAPGETPNATAGVSEPGPSAPGAAESAPADPGQDTAQPTEPRPADPQAPAGPWSLLPAPTTRYVENAATTAADVDALAPVMSPEEARAVQDADPGLDDDVAAWFDPDRYHRARLMLLGPVTATAYGEFTEVARLKALHVEALAYLALHPNGTSGAQFAEDFAVKPGRARSLVTGVRAWLGTDPRTGRLYLPDANQSAAFAATGRPAYQVDGLLVDVDLFQRLYARGQALGSDGIDDLITALRLVRGRPFDKTRTRGWTWLFEGDRLDHTMTAAIGDVAHLVCTRAMAENNYDQARWAAQVGRQANPDDETSRLDDITIQFVTGHAELARKRLAEEIYDRTDDGWPPPDPPDRTREIASRHGIITPRPDPRKE
ncbi:LysM domain-containing protein [Promicromonospora sp. AC04]|uniref:LysM peptidoglycan-binding domain-containing protein n=1 Tax=Promicromonospora sp. AC04 TaxID=2135723 RepID=UPI000D372E0A|nr:LysM peptidoglycan-binding domain-containing protein [Promicromonospora sp. AC04]PUB20858.1 LysM domain-containing protein [Promicromonospora sp. AC04]